MGRYRIFDIVTFFAKFLQFGVDRAAPFLDLFAGVTGLGVTLKELLRGPRKRIIFIRFDLDRLLGLVEVIDNRNTPALTLRGGDVREEQVAVSLPTLSIAVLGEVGIEVFQESFTFRDLLLDASTGSVRRCV